MYLNQSVGTAQVRDSHKDTVIGDWWAGSEIIYYRWDHYIADASAYNRSLPCMEVTYPYAIKTQRKVINAPSRGLWVP